MKVVKILGGLGNQMFQYAFYLWIKKHYPNDVVKLDLSDFANYKLHDGFLLEYIFQTPMNVASLKDLQALGEDKTSFSYRLRRKLGLKNSRYFHEEEDVRFLFLPQPAEKKNILLEGYWQCRDYIFDQEEKIREAFTFPEFQDEKNRQLLNEIKGCESVSFHIRRGDYVHHPKYKDICNEQYFDAAINLIAQHTKDPVFYIFSDDISWCKEKFKTLNAVYVDHNKKKESFRDMQLMSLCKHHIIANSSFSWWGAFLDNKNQGITIAPKKWKNNMEGTRSLIPVSWKQV